MKTVKIGDQEWMSENLNVDHYQNGDPIPEVKDSREWDSLKTGAWCYYNNDPENDRKYGKLYNWYAVNDPRRLAPKGWHIPNYSEFQALAAKVNRDGNALKVLGQFSRWTPDYNVSGFSSLMSGRRCYRGLFHDLCSSSYFWSSSECGKNNAKSINLYSDEDINIYENHDDKTFGFSIRCLKDQLSVHSYEHNWVSVVMSQN